MTDALTQLTRLSDFLVEDILAMTDDEIIAEAEEDGFDLEENRREMVAMVDRTEAGSNEILFGVQRDRGSLVRFGAARVHARWLR